MKSYSETHIFSESAILAAKKADRIVKVMPNDLDRDEHGLRCHELARIVARILNREYAYGHATVEDGKYEVIEHSWIALDGNRVILDVYAVGSLPQVQLIDVASIGPKHRYRFKATAYREDIRKDVVERGVEVWENFEREEQKAREEADLRELCP